MQGSVNKGTNLDEIKQRLDIVDVVSTYVRLEKSGSQLKGRCPFHSEKSPSFYVSPMKGYFHCFGCAAHGDIFTFISRIEGIEFKDALKLLADRAGVTLVNVRKEEQSKNFDILETSTKFFQNNLANNFEAMQYVQGRGIENKTIYDFRIGFALNDWRTLYTHLKSKNFTDDEIVESGLCIKHEKGLYDRFRSRVMFPIANASGKIVAFTGRIIGPDTGKEGVAKYVNSPETSVYHKSSILFGYDKAKQEIMRSKRVIIVEGQMDTVMSHQAGVIDTVAISGTALTQEHINIIKRFAETVILSLDTDKAGFEAMKKSASMALFNDLYVEALDIKDAKDPADIISESKEEWIDILSKPISIFKLFIDKILEQENDKNKQITKVRKEIFPILSMVRSEMVKENYAKEIGVYLDIETKSILADMKTLNLSEDNLSIQNRKELQDKNAINQNKSSDKSLEELQATIQAILDIFKSENTSLDIVNKYKNNLNIIIEKVKGYSLEIEDKLDLIEVKSIEIERDINKEIEINKKQGKEIEKKGLLTDYLASNYARFIKKIPESIIDDMSKIEFSDFINKNKI